MARGSPTGHDFRADPEGVKDLPSAEIEGVEVKVLTPFTDHRGTLTEVINFDDPFWAEPVVHVYKFTVRPGKIKGWGMHRKQADRYFICAGEVRVVLYDGRVGSPTHRQFAQHTFTDKATGLVRIPPGVWHADQNIGDEEVIAINFPTVAYDPNDPDKHRIDPHSGEIAFDWGLRDG